MALLLLVLLNGGVFDSLRPVTACTRLLDALAGCPESPGGGVLRSNPCEWRSSWLCSAGTAPCAHPDCRAW